MFAAPPSVIAEVFCRIPDRFRRSEPTEWARVQLQGAPAPVFLEGPAFDRVVDMIKGLDRAVVIENVRIVAKSGGRSGDWVRPGESVQEEQA